MMNRTINIILITFLISTTLSRGNNQNYRAGKNYGKNAGYQPKPTYRNNRNTNSLRNNAQSTAPMTSDEIEVITNLFNEKNSTILSENEAVVSGTKKTYANSTNVHYDVEVKIGNSQLCYFNFSYQNKLKKYCKSTKSNACTRKVSDCISTLDKHQKRVEKEID